MRPYIAIPVPLPLWIAVTGMTSVRRDGIMTDENTHFGFQSVPLDEKQGKVNEVFRSVASRYDLMNDLMSAGPPPPLEGRARHRPCARPATGPSAISTWPAAPATWPSASSMRAGRRPA